eukprot:1181094-Prorocentrum_minimum.AAC.3
MHPTLRVRAPGRRTRVRTAGGVLVRGAAGVYSGLIFSPLLRLVPATGIFSLPFCDWCLGTCRVFPRPISSTSSNRPPLRRPYLTPYGPPMDPLRTPYGPPRASAPAGSSRGPSRPPAAPAPPSGGRT